MVLGGQLPATHNPFFHVITCVATQLSVGNAGPLQPWSSTVLVEMQSGQTAVLHAPIVQMG